MSNHPRLCLYHDNCTDGFGSAYAVWKRFGDECKFIAVSHGQPPPEIGNEHIVIVDFSYPEQVIRDMLLVARSITILDHHKTAEAALAPLSAQLIDGIFDMRFSGAVLAWKYYLNDEVPQLLLHVQDRDLWQWKLPNTREICSWLDSHERKFLAWDSFANLCRKDDIRAQLIAEGGAIERKQKRDIVEMLQICKRTMTIGGHLVPVANLPPSWASDAGHIMAQDAPFAACYFDRIDGRIFSLRSREDGVDVSEIAKQYGGGGHQHASGFQMPLGWAGDHPVYPEE